MYGIALHAIDDCAISITGRMDSAPIDPFPIRNNEIEEDRHYEQYQLHRPAKVVD